MPTLYHAPESRSDTVVTLIHMLGADVDVKEVTIPRQDGSGVSDPANPHPEKKVPYLVDGDEHVRERGAIMLYLTDKYPQAKLGPLPGEAGRGACGGQYGAARGAVETRRRAGPGGGGDAEAARTSGRRDGDGVEGANGVDRSFLRGHGLNSETI